MHNLISAFQKPDQGIITPLQHPVINHAKATHLPGTYGVGEPRPWLSRALHGSADGGLRLTCVLELN